MDVTALRTELHLAHRELRWVRTEQEHQAEALARARRKRVRLREQVEELSDALAETLSAAYWEQQGTTGLLRRRTMTDEAALVQEVEQSPLFDGGWYLRKNPSAVRKRTSPALHYVSRRRHTDPGPDFSVQAYLAAHPEAEDAGLPLLVHAGRNGWLADGDPSGRGADRATDTHDVHL